MKSRSPGNEQLSVIGYELTKAGQELAVNIRRAGMSGSHASPIWLSELPPQTLRVPFHFELS